MHYFHPFYRFTDIHCRSVQLGVFGSRQGSGRETVRKLRVQPTGFRTSFGLHKNEHMPHPSRPFSFFGKVGIAETLDSTLVALVTSFLTYRADSSKADQDPSLANNTQIFHWLGGSWSKGRRLYLGVSPAVWPLSTLCLCRSYPRALCYVRKKP